jgi:hypothetical protein
VRDTFRGTLTLGSFALALALAAPAEGAVFTVGPPTDLACTHNTITAGLLAAAFALGDDEVRLARNQTYTEELLHLTNWAPGNALILSGGWDGCADGSPGGNTAIDGRSNAPVVWVDTTGAGSSVVTLRRLSLTGSGERGLLVEGDSTVTLNETVVSGNDDGGIDLGAGTTVTVDFASVVHGNSTGGNGGGIHCAGGHLRLSGVVGNPGAGNVAGFHGGGIFAGAGCELELLDGAIVQSNEALDGGGIFAAGATVTADAAGLGISINNNVAAADGGGVYATGAGTDVSLVDTGVELNQAMRGGGLFVAADAVLTMDQDDDCVSAPGCSRLNDNTLVPAGGTHGAAAALITGGQLDVYQTQVARNRIANPDPAAGMIFSGQGGGTRLRLEGVVLFGNEAPELFVSSGGAAAEIAFVTASRNGRTPPHFPVPAHPLFVGLGSTATVHSSIFWPNGSFRAFDGGEITEADCLLVSSTVGLPVGASRVSTADPLFRDAAAGNLRPRAFSPAIDFCDATRYVPGHGDLDGELRGQDLPWDPNGSPGSPGGTFDLGADEVLDFFFYDGFESGTVDAWSFSTP